MGTLCANLSVSFQIATNKDRDAANETTSPLPDLPHTRPCSLYRCVRAACGANRGVSGEASSPHCFPCWDLSPSFSHRPPSSHTLEPFSPLHALRVRKDLYPSSLSQPPR